MKISPFLTDIARGYNPHVECVGFDDLTNLKRKPLGIAWQRYSQVYYIEIDRERLICPHQVLYVLFHELGHINQWHLGYRHFLGGRSYQEEEADNWAFEKMGMINKQGQVKEESKLCYQCMETKSKVCLKGFDIE